MTKRKQHVPCPPIESQNTQNNRNFRKFSALEAAIVYSPTIVHSISGYSNLIQSVLCNDSSNASNIFSSYFSDISTRELQEEQTNVYNLCLRLLMDPREPSKNSISIWILPKWLCHWESNKHRRRHHRVSRLDHLATSSPEKFRDDPHGDQRQVAHMPRSPGNPANPGNGAVNVAVGCTQGDKAAKVWRF